MCVYDLGLTLCVSVNGLGKFIYKLNNCMCICLNHKPGKCVVSVKKCKSILSNSILSDVKQCKACNFYFGGGGRRCPNFQNFVGDGLMETQK